MKNKKSLPIAGILSIAILLAGCGSIPDMSEHDTEMVSEYSASLLLKYDSGNHSRLVDTEPFLNEYYNALNLQKAEEEAYYDAIREEEEIRRSENEEQENAISNGISVVETIGQMAGSDGTGGASVIDNESVESFLGLNSFKFDFIGTSLVDEYPEGEDSFYFVINASTNKKLLVAYFDVTNNSTEEQLLDLFNSGYKFKLSVNGNGYTNVLTTLLEDDMSVYLDTFNPGETKRLTLIVEVNASEQISSLGLRISGNQGTLTKSLF